MLFYKHMPRSSVAYCSLASVQEDKEGDSPRLSTVLYWTDKFGMYPRSRTFCNRVKRYLDGIICYSIRVGETGYQSSAPGFLGTFRWMVWAMAGESLANQSSCWLHNDVQNPTAENWCSVSQYFRRVQYGGRCQGQELNNYCLCFNG